MSLNGVVFDLDETLIDRSSAVAAFAHNLWIDYLSDSAVPVRSFIDDVHHLDGHGYTARAEFFQQMWLKLAGVVPSKEMIEESFYQEVWETPRLAEGVKTVLSLLRRQSVPLAIVSNGSKKAQETKIKSSGIAEYFEVIVISESFGVKKPDPSIYEEAAARLGLATGDCWFVGDHPVNDIWGSKQVGYQTAWVHLNRPWATEVEPCYDVTGETFGTTMKLVMQGA